MPFSLRGARQQSLAAPRWAEQQNSAAGGLAIFGTDVLEFQGVKNGLLDQLFSLFQATDVREGRFGNFRTGNQTGFLRLSRTN